MPDDAFSDATNVRGSRIGAALIDFLVLLVPLALVALAFLQKRPGLESCDEITASLQSCVQVGDDFYVATGGRVVAWQLVNALVGIAYYVVLQGLTGRTVGKAAVGIRVVNRSGQICGIPRALARYVPFLVPGVIPGLGLLLGPIVLIVEFVLVLAHPRRQRLGDMLGKTYVVRKDAVGTPLTPA